ncbi:hypothetical protein CFD26_104445 [Aspergillus turcosus]|uniref:Cytochrome P450 n=1 Tax=Aspergillus turcosus TaxID=1245748 RepID=A0A3R7HUX9_9EURO|nr:hypothetical protein CFD26_104445 [Aspergillus turcosus]
MIALLVLIGAALTILWRFNRKGNRLPLPPGPKPLPIIGNLHQEPSKDRWLQYHEWHKKYGPLVSMRLGQRTVISVGSHQAANELLTKRSHIYSSRPRFIIMGECAFRNLNTALIPYGPQWRTHHRIQARFLKANHATHYGPVQDIESKHLVRDLLSLRDFPKVFLRYAYSMNSTLAYGQRVDTVDAHAMVELSSVSKAIGEISATVLGVMVEMFPILNRLPAPLAPWKQAADRGYARALALYERNCRLAETSPSWNWVRGAQSMKESKTVSREEFANIIGFVFDAGSETVAGALEMFVLAAVSNNAVMRKAQEEIDRVVGPERLPTMQDLPNLPYTCAVAVETLRWRPLAPMGFPHELMEDDEYMGYRIPKGAMVLPNHWAMDLDETVFERATEFRPERWLENPELPLAAFGFGRRGCPGRHIAKDSLRISVARMLWTFDLLPGKSTVNTWDLQQGLLAPPTHFEAQFQLRSPEREAIIQLEWESTDKNTDRMMQSIKELID